MNLDLIVFILEIFYEIKKKDEAYVINLNEYSNIEIHWIALYALNNNVNYLIVLL